MNNKGAVWVACITMACMLCVCEAPPLVFAFFSIGTNTLLWLMEDN